MIFQAGNLESLRHGLQHSLSPGRLQAWSAHCLDTLQSFTYVQATQGLMRALDFVR
ncbi:MAG: hypothetical protein HC904_15215 [Blastochloris sp.]|nr:hypothetical protein [Blastochloris sp.]